MFALPMTTVDPGYRLLTITSIPSVLCFEKRNLRELPALKPCLLAGCFRLAETAE